MATPPPPLQCLLGASDMRMRYPVGDLGLLGIVGPKSYEIPPVSSCLPPPDMYLMKIGRAS